MNDFGSEFPDPTRVKHPENWHHNKHLMNYEPTFNVLSSKYNDDINMKDFLKFFNSRLKRQP